MAGIAHEFDAYWKDCKLAASSTEFIQIVRFGQSRCRRRTKLIRQTPHNVSSRDVIRDAALASGRVRIGSSGALAYRIRFSPVRWIGSGSVPIRCGDCPPRGIMDREGNSLCGSGLAASR